MLGDRKPQIVSIEIKMSGKNQLHGYFGLIVYPKLVHVKTESFKIMAMCKNLMKQIIAGGSTAIRERT